MELAVLGGRRRKGEKKQACPPATTVFPARLRRLQDDTLARCTSSFVFISRWLASSKKWPPPPADVTWKCSPQVGLMNKQPWLISVPI